MKVKLTLLLITFLLIPLQSALGQSNNEQNREEQTAPATKRFMTKMLEVKRGDPERIVPTLRTLGSREKGSQVTFDQGFKVIIVRDYPENIAVMEEALKRLDVPMPSPVSLDVQLHLIAASRQPVEKTTFPAELQPVINQLRSTLKYEGYRLVTTFLNRVWAGEGVVWAGERVEANGVADALFNLPASAAKSFYNYSLGGIRLVPDAAGKDEIQLRDFRFNLKVPIQSSGGFPQIQYQDVGIRTGLSMREGEMVVVGTANVGSSDEAIIVVVSVKKVK
jgi:hypothetical protein